MDRRRATQILALLGGVTLFAADDKQPRKLSDAELEKLLQDEKNLFFLDVREPKEIQELGSIKGYVNIPLGQLESRLSEIPKNKLIITA
jgi:rhodanese-related sulfurtransferase